MYIHIVYHIQYDYIGLAALDRGTVIGSDILQTPREQYLTNTYVCIYIYIYIERERERDR